MANVKITELPDIEEVSGADVLPIVDVSGPVTSKVTFTDLRAAVLDGVSGAEEWSEHAATQDVDMDGHKITGLGAPSASDDAATKQYVDTVAGAAPAKIELAGSIVEILPNGDIEIWHGGTKVADVVMMGSPSDPVFRLLAPHPSYPGHFYVRPGGDASLSVGGGWSGFTFAYSGDSILRSHNVNFPITSNGYRAMPSGVSSIVHGVHLAKDAHDTLASMPAPPELEWWDPVWTPVSNVDSVSNVECSYTRTYRASGGSLVTLEGTITVEIDEDDEPTILSAPLPVPATSTGAPIAPAIGVDISRGDRADCRATVTDLGSGPVLVIAAGELSNATGVPATLTIGFRISYRAA